MELLLIAVVVGAGTILWIASHFDRANRLIDEWARSRGLTIVRRNRTWTRVGPGRRLGTNQVLRYLTVREASGAERKVWLLLGSDSLGLVDSEIDEIWE